MNTHDTFAEAYLKGLKNLLQYGQNVGSVRDSQSTASNFGKGDRPAVELIGYSFQVNNPLSSLFICKHRPLRLAYCFGLFLWSLAASNRVDWLSYYNPLAKLYSDDEVYLCGAFGKRLLDFDDTINQLESITSRLTVDPNSRRTVAAIITPEDNIKNSREYPCGIAVQYFLRDGFLHSITYMRAQSAMIVLPYDVFLFMTLQCYIASKMNVKVGYYKHIAGTFHIYESEKELAAKILAEGVIPVSLGRMTNKKNDWDKLYELEKDIRGIVSEGNTTKLLPIINHWKENITESFISQSQLILMIFGLIKLRQSDEAIKLISLVSSPLKELIESFIVLET